MAKDKPKTTAKDFFLWLGAMVSLYVSAVSLITLVFQYVNYTFPDELQYYTDPYSGAIRFAISSLIVLFPLFLYLMRKINRDMKEDPTKEGYLDSPLADLHYAVRRRGHTCRKPRHADQLLPGRRYYNPIRLKSRDGVRRYRRRVYL